MERRHEKEELKEGIVASSSTRTLTLFSIPVGEQVVVAISLVGAALSLKCNRKKYCLVLVSYKVLYSLIHEFIAVLYYLVLLNIIFTNLLIGKSGVVKRQRGQGIKYLLFMDSGGSTTRAGIYVTFHPYLLVVVGELRPTDTQIALNLHKVVAPFLYFNNDILSKEKYIVI